MEEASIVLERRKEFAPQIWMKELSMVPSKSTTAGPGCNSNNQKAVTINEKVNGDNGNNQSRHDDNNPIMEHE
eukprot:CAMPEP_0203658490 /NCGR_PEP_ID=MMETSP0088-20131115/48373_1 /ASSEMBLY_ACC=CAM_ASM_001087 /TAXON_ID=426623 /ORGANISM="Chaetoceros affinis, Strain CCMP159" /LENGTH=72 /DNA_ID=CAMNT_0050520179 /DNA_START=87 /DNA_END=302 /DNA_ORIENTATION=+